MAFGPGYGGFGISPYGPLGGSLPTSPPYTYPGIMPGAPGQDQFVGSGHHKKKKKGLEGFFQGIYNGAANMVKGMFTLPGIAMTAATAGLVWATGGAALIPLAAIGASIGGFQMLKGIGQGSAEGFGEGVFTTATSLLGLKFTPKNVNLNGKTFTLGESREKLGILGRFKSMWGGEKYRSGDDVLNMGQMFREKITSRFQSKSDGDALSVANLARHNSTSPKSNASSINDWVTAQSSSRGSRSSAGSSRTGSTNTDSWVTASDGLSDTASVTRRGSRSNTGSSHTGSTKFSDARSHISDNVVSVVEPQKPQRGFLDRLLGRNKDPKIKTD